ncbi:acetylxylan esterase [Candidatus Sumerlaeota bacterium]|nr:acetylxylan esterase [Candidatus Sumerlaeota bacterium]
MDNTRTNLASRRGMNSRGRFCAFAAALCLPFIACAGFAGEEEGEIQLQKFSKLWSTLPEWQARAAAIRQGILRGANLDPLPARCPLNPIIHSKREYNGYSVENVAFESLPGFYVTGNLYRPLGRTGKLPVILNPHGHFQDPVYSARTRPDMQTRCAMFARMGAIAFSYDMVGYGESNQTAHSDPNVLTLQTWDSMRVLDFLLGFPDADPARVAVTGASGGGTQSFLITALDDRITCSAPVVMVAAHFFCGCKCESGLPIHQNPETNNAEIAACAAPRPTLIVSDGDDWTHNVPGIEFPYIWKVYRMFDKEKDVENCHLPFDHHDYGYSKRAPVYEFFARHLGMERIAVNPLNGKTPPEDIVIEEHKKLLVWDESHPRPANALRGSKAIEAVLFPGKK